MSIQIGNTDSPYRVLLDSVVFASSFVVWFLECAIAKSLDMQVCQLAV